MIIRLFGQFRKVTLFSAFILSCALFAGCAESTPEISPMPALDSSKNTVTQETEQVETTEAVLLESRSPILLSDPVEELSPQGSNTENNGIAAEYDGTIYYMDNGLCSMSVNGYHNRVLTEQNDILYLSLYENYIYYVATENYSVYRLDIDSGNNPEQLDISGAYAMSIIGNHIYYQNSVGLDADNYIYRTDMNGENKENLMIKSSVYTSDGQTIYFANEDEQNQLFSLDTCTGEITKLSNNQASQINVMNGCIYYVNRTTKHPTKLNLETSESTILMDENVSYLNSNGEILVFYASDKGLLGTADQNGENIDYILEYDDINGLNVAGDWIFFESYEKTFSGETFFLKTDGSELSKDLPVTSMAMIVDYDAEQKIVYVDYINYYTGEDAITQYIHDNSVSERKAEEIIAAANGIYIQNNNRKIIEYKMSDLTSITLNINADSSYSATSYSTDASHFEELYAKDTSLILNQLYTITAFDGELIKLEQFYEPVASVAE